MQAAEPAARQASRRPLVAAAVVLAAAVLGGGWWVTHPTRLGAVGSKTSVQVTVGQPVLVGLFAYPRSGSVMLRDATPRVAPGSAAATVRVLWCLAPTGGSPVGAVRATAQAFCAESPSLGGQRLTRPTTDTRFGHLVVEIVPLEPGEVTVEGADVAYSAGLQRGSQRSGVVIKVAVSR